MHAHSGALRAPSAGCGATRERLVRRSHAHGGLTAVTRGARVRVLLSTASITYPSQEAGPHIRAAVGVPYRGRARTARTVGDGRRGRDQVGRCGAPQR